MKTTWLLSFLVLALSVLVVGCGSDEKSSAAVPESTGSTDSGAAMDTAGSSSTGDVGVDEAIDDAVVDENDDVQIGELI
jgi:hypothetical protein